MSPPACAGTAPRPTPPSCARCSGRTGITCLLVDELDPGEFAVFAGVVHRAYDHALRDEAASLVPWERLLTAVRDDPRFGPLPRR